ncbi:hypothetical protein I6H96_02760 [Brucella anthropi]|uniref:hypothetical protein n=1 Tax=Brucella anthropi TaxID=529 RepID=UPI00059F7E1A|nr:hypothetical protein [Brucella anthropi]QQC25802.1 hypothetical protein I6H96_02760 [Brucella anthropi]SUA65376.1 Uncharacterised protein [Brucella anthropi]
MTANAKPAEAIEFSTRASEVLDRSISIHRAAIRRNADRLRTIQTDRAEAVARIDDELFEAERAFIEKKKRLLGEKADFCAHADKEIAALTRLTEASKLALGELVRAEGDSDAKV